jgi:hypothetical protein
VVKGDISRELMSACINQEWVGKAPVKQAGFTPLSCMR